MSYINESCGCSGGSNYDVINNSPILSGSQEAAFSPMADSFAFLDGLNEQNTGNVNSNNILASNNNNNFSNNDENKQNFSLDDLISMSKENNTSNENKFSNNNIQEMNNNQFNNSMNTSQPTNEMLGNSLNTNMNNNIGMNNNMNMNNNMAMNNNLGVSMPDPGMMRNIPTNVNPELQMVMNKIAQANQANQLANKTEVPEEERESAGRFILKNFNIVLIVIIGLAWSDVAKFYINRSIKFGGGNHRYYIYYAVIASVVLYGTSKYIHSL